MQTSVLVVSAFGRGLGLAARIAENEIPVQLLDVSEDLGKTSPEDDEGPFGFFQLGLNSISLERMQQEDSPLNLQQGLVFVLPSGPLELKSPLTKNRLEKIGITSDQLDRLRDFSAKKKTSDEHNSFEKTWIHQFASNWLSHTSELVPCSPLSDFTLPLASDFWIRPITRPGILKSFEWCERKGIRIHRDLQILDVASGSSKTLKAVEVRKRNQQTSEVLPFEQIVWCLTSQETEFLNSKVFEKLFPRGLLLPRWVWTRFRFRILSGKQREVLPQHSIWIQDLDLAWTHDNLFVLQQSPSPDLFDAWIRLPADQRLQRSYLVEQHDKILRALRTKLTLLDVQKAEDPAASEKTYREMGPARFSVYDRKQLLEFKGSDEVNLSFHSPEVWPALGWNALAQFEESLSKHLNMWWQHREELRKKRELKNRKD